MYYGFISISYSDHLYPDPVTATVAYQTQQFINMSSYQAHILNTVDHPSITMYLNKSVVYRVIEGCNGISVMILFVSFVLAFAKSFKTTISFIGIGLVVIYIINLLRLVALAIIKYELPQYDHISHDILFPAIIYGTVILLWIYWVRPKQVR